MARCLVTGGAGFIGSHIVDALLERGHDVRVLDNFATGDRANLRHLVGEIELIEGDLRSFERVATATRGCDLVFHQAALPSVPRSIQDPLTSSEVNVTGTLNVLLAARDGGVQRVVYASSSSVYGSSGEETRRETLPVAPLSPYGVAKYAGEAYCLSFHEVYGLETVSLRYFNVFGPRQSPFSEYSAVIPKFFSAALLGEDVVIYGDGEQTRDFTYVGNVVDANLLAATAPQAAGAMFNVACGRQISVNELRTAVSAIAGRNLKATYLPPRPGEIRTSAADISRAMSLLGYQPRVGLVEGLNHVHEFFLKEPSLLDRVSEGRRWQSRPSVAVAR